MTWTEALQQVPLAPGTYQGVVHGHPAELTIKPEPAPADEDSPEPDGPPYLLPWFEIPDPPFAVMKAVPGDPFPLKPFVIKDSDLAPG